MLGSSWLGLVWDTFSCFLTSLASGGVLRKLGSIGVMGECGDGSVVSRIVGATLGGRSVPVVCHGPFIVLTCCGGWGCLIMRFWIVGALWPSSSYCHPRLPLLYGVLCCC